MAPSESDIASDESSSQWNGDSDDSEDDLHGSVDNVTSNRSTRQTKRGSASASAKSEPGKRLASQRGERSARASHPPKPETQRSRTCGAKESLSNKQKQRGASFESQPSMLASDTPQQIAAASVEQPDNDNPTNAHQEPDCTASEQADEDAAAVRAANIKALLSDTVQAERTTLMPKFLKVRFLSGRCSRIVHCRLANKNFV